MSWLWMGGVAVLAVALSLWPLWAGSTGSTPRRRALNVASYRTRMAEIEDEVEAGTVEPESAQALRDETAARLLADAAPEDAAPEPAVAERRSWLLAVVGAALIVAVSGVGYYLADSRQIAAWIAEAGRDPVAGQRLAMESMVQRLEQRLEREPDDAEGWAMLGRSYSAQGRYAEAATAYERANRLSSGAPDADWLAAEAEVRIMAQDERSLQGLPRQLFERSLTADPGHAKSLWYAGLAAAQAGDYGVALDRWLALRQTELPDDFRAVLDARLPELAQLAGRALPEAQVAAPAGPRLRIEVAVDPALAGAVAAGDTLFVLARRPGAAGPPLAVRRMTAAELPLQVMLDDSNAMAPAFKLSTADRWEVVARISRSGAPQAQPGDLEGSVLVEAAQAGQPIALKIDRRLP